jgi:hypothetical protein
MSKTNLFQSLLVKLRNIFFALIAWLKRLFGKLFRTPPITKQKILQIESESVFEFSGKFDEEFIKEFNKKFDSAKASNKSSETRTEAKENEEKKETKFDTSSDIKPINERLRSLDKEVFGVVVQPNLEEKKPISFTLRPEVSQIDLKTKAKQAESDSESVQKKAQEKQIEAKLIAGNFSSASKKEAEKGSMIWFNKVSGTLGPKMPQNQFSPESKALKNLIAGKIAAKKLGLNKFTSALDGKNKSDSTSNGRSV